MKIEDCFNSRIDLSEMKILKIGFGTPFLIPKDLTLEEVKYLVASQLTIAFGNKSVDNTLKVYLSDIDDNQRMSKVCEKEELLNDVLEISKAQQKELQQKLKELKFPTETPSNFACLTVLTRLETTFRSIHSLISLGYYFESFAMIRLVLEQLAYAYTAALVDIEKTDFQSPTKSISELKKFYSKAGLLYGILSKKAHIDKSEIHKYIEIEDGQVFTLNNSIEFSLEVSFYLPAILDIQYCVFEFCFKQQLDVFNCIALTKDGFAIMPDRKTKSFEEYAERIEIILNKK